MSKAKSCLECCGPIPTRHKLIAGNQPGFCSVTCRSAHRKSYLRAWWKANRDRELPKLAARVKAFNDKNPDYFKKHYAKDRERKKAQRRQWYKANTERAQRTQRQYNKAHPDLIRNLGRKSQAKRRAIVQAVFVETVDPRVVFRRDKGVCGICRRPVDVKSKWEIDHVIPISKGGAHAYDNVQLSHRRCNRSKGNKLSLCHRSP